MCVSGAVDGWRIGDVAQAAAGRLRWWFGAGPLALCWTGRFEGDQHCCCCCSTRSRRAPYCKPLPWLPPLKPAYETRLQCLLLLPTASYRQDCYCTWYRLQHPRPEGAAPRARWGDEAQMVGLQDGASGGLATGPPSAIRRPLLASTLLYTVFAPVACQGSMFSAGGQPVGTHMCRTPNGSCSAAGRLGPRPPR